MLCDCGHETKSGILGKYGIVCQPCFNTEDHAGSLTSTEAVQTPTEHHQSPKDGGGLPAMVSAYKTLRRRLPPEWPNVRIWSLASVIVRRSRYVREGRGTLVSLPLNDKPGSQVPAKENKDMALTVKVDSFKVGDWVRVDKTNRPAIVSAVGADRCMVEYNDGTMEDFNMSDLRYVFRH